MTKVLIGKASETDSLTRELFGFHFFTNEKGVWNINSISALTLQYFSSTTDRQITKSLPTAAWTQNLVINIKKLIRAKKDIDRR